MNHNTAEEGFVFDVVSLYEHLEKLEDRRDTTQGVLCAGDTVLVLMYWPGRTSHAEARNGVKLRKEMLARTFELKRTQMAHHTTVSRILRCVVDVEAFERVVRAVF